MDGGSPGPPGGPERSSGALSQAERAAQLERSIANGTVPWTPMDIRPWVVQMAAKFKKPTIEILNYPPLPYITLSMQTIEDVGESCALRTVIAGGGGAVHPSPLSLPPSIRPTLPLPSIRSLNFSLARHDTFLPRGVS
jgi:hypothetical protein